jgi:hypothetical protein
VSGVDLAVKFDALNTRFKAEYDLAQALNLECHRLYEEFKKCWFWQIGKQAKLVAALRERHSQMAERVTKMSAIYSEMESARKDIQELLAAVRRDQLNTH